MVVYSQVLFWGLAVVCFGIALARSEDRSAAFVIDRLLRYLMLFPLGATAVLAWSGHVFAPEQVAPTIGWKPSPFEFEVGFANLGMGLAAIVAAFAGQGFRVATTIVAATFLWGAAIGHVIQIVEVDNLAPGNAGLVLWLDIIVPALAVILVVAAWRRPLAARGER